MKTPYMAEKLPNGLMRVTKTSMTSRKQHSLDLPVSFEELERHARGAHAQDVWPRLTATEREFLISGITGEEWDSIFGGTEDERID